MSDTVHLRTPRVYTLKVSKSILTARQAYQAMAVSLSIPRLYPYYGLFFRKSMVHLMHNANKEVFNTEYKREEQRIYSNTYSAIFKKNVSVYSMSIVFFMNKKRNALLL